MTMGNDLVERLLAEVAIREAYPEDYDERLTADMRSVLERIQALEAELARKTEALRPFAMDGWADENGWTDRGCPNDRVSDWFGPSDFRAARSALEEKTDV